jgi:nucleoside-diphosphate-sugar epimerase
MTYVEDTAAGFVAAARADAAIGRTIQLGVGEAVSIGEIVERVAALLGRELVVETDKERIRPARSEVQLLLSDPSRARELMGWAPSLDLEEGLSRTIAWIEANRVRFRVGHYVI